MILSAAQRAKKTKVTEHFSDYEVRWLPKWGRLAEPGRDGMTHEIWANINRMADKMEEIRAIFNCPLIIHSWFRPREYNLIIGGARNSAHMYGLAVDFSIKGMRCDDIRAVLVDMLDDLDIRMEDLPGSSWVHVDIRSPGPGGRYFKP